MINPARCNISLISELAFWQRILADGALQECADLEKLLVGCEIIAAVDDLDLLAA